MRRLVLAATLAATVLGCQPTGPAIETTDPRVTVGAQRSCSELGLSEVRCTLVTLRAARQLDEARPGHVSIDTQALHEAGAPPAGQSPIPASQAVAAVVVFTLDDGSRIGVPVLCPTDPSGGDQACDPRIQ